MMILPKLFASPRSIFILLTRHCRYSLLSDDKNFSDDKTLYAKWSDDDIFLMLMMITYHVFLILMKACISRVKLINVSPHRDLTMKSHRRAGTYSVVMIFWGINDIIDNENDDDIWRDVDSVSGNLSSGAWPPNDDDDIRRETDDWCRYYDDDDDNQMVFQTENVMAWYLFLNEILFGNMAAAIIDELDDDVFNHFMLLFLWTSCDIFLFHAFWLLTPKRDDDDMMMLMMTWGKWYAIWRHCTDKCRVSILLIMSHYLNMYK